MTFAQKLPWIVGSGVLGALAAIAVSAILQQLMSGVIDWPETIATGVVLGIVLAIVLPQFPNFPR